MSVCLLSSLDIVQIEQSLTFKPSPAQLSLNKESGSVKPEQTTQHIELVKLVADTAVATQVQH